MGEYAPDPWITSIVFEVSIDHRPYKNLIDRILLKAELPTLNEIIKEFNENKTASGVIDENLQMCLTKDRNQRQRNKMYRRQMLGLIF